jgi:predicted nucleotidyltransferase component of viral defense system
VQFVILDSFSYADLARSLAFKGGNALRFGYRYPRSTIDLDFTAHNLDDNAVTLRNIIDAAVRERSSEFGLKCKVTSIHRNPASLTRTLPTYTVKIGYSFPADRHFAEFLDSPRPTPNVVPVEISFNDVVCETVIVDFGDHGGTRIELCTLNDIVAEKLRAILQQVIRNRNRPQDVYDIARILSLDNDKLDLSRVKLFLIEKCSARDIVFCEEAFGEAARSRAEYGYGELRKDLGDQFIPFEDAWAAVRLLVRKLVAGEPASNQEQ